MGVSKTKTLIPAPEDSISYEIVPTETVIHADSGGTILTGSIKIEVYRSVGESREKLPLGSSTKTDGYYYWMQYSRDGSSWYTCSHSGTEAEVSVYAVVLTQDHLKLRLVRNTIYSGTNAEVVKEHPALRVVKDGQPGGTGAKGQMMYPAGIWSSTTSYESTSTLTPYVMWNNQYWYIKKENYTSLAEEPSANSTTWGLADRLTVVFIEALFAAFGKLGSAIFYDEWMFSQYGEISGAVSQSYQSFVKSDPEGTAQGHFRPNLALDLLRGKAYLNDAVIRGVLKVMAIYTVKGSIVTVNGSKVIDLENNPGNSYVLPGNETVYLPDPSAYEGLTLTILFSAGSVLAYEGSQTGDGIYMAYYTGSTRSNVTQNGMSFKAAHSSEGLTVLTIQSIAAYGSNSGTKWVVVGQRGVIGVRQAVNGADIYKVLPDGLLLT